MTTSNTEFNPSNSAAAIAGETISGCSRPTTVLLTLVTARRLWLKECVRGGGGVDDLVVKREVVELEAAAPAPAVKFVAEYGGNRRVVPIVKMSHFFIVGRTLDVPRKENLTS